MLHAEGTIGNVSTVTDEMIEEMNRDLEETYRAIDAEMQAHIDEDDRAFMATCDLGSFAA